MRYLPLVTGLVLVSQVGAQSGRHMHLLAPAVIGGTALFGMTHPVAAAGNPYAFLISLPPLPLAVPLTVPGVNVVGLIRVDLANAVTAAIGTLDGSGATAPYAVMVPNDPLLTGAPFDIQGIDFDAATITLYLADDDQSVVVAGVAGSNMVPIAPGTFWMGTTHPAAGSSAQPVHQVTISRPFWIGRHEVTQAEYQALVGSNPSLFLGPSNPVETVSWNAAMNYCALLTAQQAALGLVPSGYQYRLPTEAEWEYCCRAGTTTEYAFGDTLSCAQACINHCPSYAVPVGSYPANAWGLHDMHGNVQEWVLDAWDYYPSGPVVDPYVSTITTQNVRMQRGGFFYNPFTAAMSGRRGGSNPNFGYESDGFRVVLAPILVP